VLGIRLKLMSTFVVIALFTGLLGWYAIATIEKLNTGQRTTYRDIFGGTHLLATWIDRAWETRRALITYTSTKDPDRRAALRAQMAAADADLAELEARIDDADSDRAEVAALGVVEKSWSEYARWRDVAVAESDAAGDPQMLVAAYETDGAQLDSAIDGAIDGFLEAKREAGGELEQSAEITYSEARQLAIALSLGAVALALGVGWFMAQHVASAARQVATAAEGLSRGELSQRIDVYSNDELGQMAASFRRMIAHQQHMAEIANAIAQGDLTRAIQPTSDADVLGNAFRQMSRNLRSLVDNLQDSLEYTRRVLDDNRVLHKRLRRAALQTAALNEQALRRIGADLHDGPCQALALSLLHLNGRETEFESWQRVRSSVSEALMELRSIASGLRLPELAELRLPEVVERAVRDHERRSGGQMRLELGNLSTDAAVDVKIALFRALQESLSNATRHAGGAEVTVHVWAADDWLWLRVADCGPGFSTNGSRPNGRLGLSSMRERAELLGGRFRLISDPGHGTVVELCWPIAGPPLTQTWTTDEEPISLSLELERTAC
jgi:signal transduction histidine kinase